MQLIHLAQKRSLLNQRSFQGALWVTGEWYLFWSDFSLNFNTILYVSRRIRNESIRHASPMSPLSKVLYEERTTARVISACFSFFLIGDSGWRERQFSGLSLIGYGNSLHSTSLALNIPNPGNYLLSYLIRSGDEQKKPLKMRQEYLRAYPPSSPLCVYLLGTAIHRGGSRPEVYKSCLQFLPPTNVNNASSSAGRPPPAHHE